MIIPVNMPDTIPSVHTVITVRCPACRRMGTFAPPPELSDLRVHLDSGEIYLMGQRRCPNPECRAHLFFVAEAVAIQVNRAGVQLLATYPAERVDFDATNLPTPVLAALEEAIT